MLRLGEINGMLEYAQGIKEDLQCDYGCIVEIVSEHKSWGYTVGIRLFDNNYNLYRQYNTGVLNHYLDYINRLYELKQQIINECF